MNKIDLDGQVAVVTGGAQGIGFAIAKRLVESGARVSLWDMNAELLGKAETALGDAVGLTFQQVQKYERGANRMGSSRLYEFSKVLDVPKARVKILSGMTSRLKQVAVDGDPKILGEMLRQAIADKPEKTKD